MSASRVGDWFENWHPVTIPLLTLAFRTVVSVRLGASYPFGQFPADMSYYGVTFYVWALTCKSTGINVCPRDMGIGEWKFVIFFLILNFAVYVLSYPSPTGVSFMRALVLTCFATLCGFGSALWLRGNW